MIHIVIPIFNAMAFLEECLDSLRKQTYRDFRTIVVDDGSTDGSMEFLRVRYPEVHVVRGTGDWWWTKSMNAGLEEVLKTAGPDDFLLSLNIDLFVGPDYLQRLMNAASVAQPCVIGSPVADRDAPGSLVFAGVEWSPWTARYKGLREPKIRKFGPVICWKTDMLPGRGTLFPIEVFRKAGLFNADQLPQYAADEDMSLRAGKAGYSLLIAPSAVVYSFVRATGLNFQVSGDRSLRAFLTSLRSKRSPYYLKSRFHFGMAHGKIGSLYVLFDLIRICGSFVRHWIRTLRLKPLYRIRGNQVEDG